MHNDGETGVPSVPENIVIILSEMVKYRQERIDVAMAWMCGVPGVVHRARELSDENTAARDYLMALVFQDAARRGMARNDDQVGHA